MKNFSIVKRILSIVLCVILAVSMLPVGAMALELHELNILDDVVAAVETEDSILIKEEAEEIAEESVELAEATKEENIEEDEVDGEPEIEEVVEIRSAVVNPLYQDILTEEDILASVSYDAPTLSSGATCTDIYSAADYLRQQMVARTENIVIQYQAELTDYETEASELADDIWEEALVHTGVPTEGDYLRGQLGGWSMSINASYTDSAPTLYDMTITYTPVYFTTAEQEAQVTERVNELMAAFAFTDATTEYRKIRDIYAWICTAVAYDYAHFGEDETTGSCGDYMPHSCYNALFNGVAVCQGYAVLFYRLALETGLDARYVDGLATSGGLSSGHAWNIVQLDGAWYLLDVTWDEAQTADSYQWFLKGTEDFVDHYANAGQIESHSLSTTSYELPQEDGSSRTEGDYTYTVLAGEATITAYTGTEKDVVVPATLGGYPVVYVAREAFSSNDTMETLTFSEGLEYIDGWAIWRCSKLKEISFPATLSMVTDTGGILGVYGDQFCAECPYLENIFVSDSNPCIASVDGVLYSKDMTLLMMYPAGKTARTFSVPDGVTELRDQAFDGNTYLTDVELPNSLEIIGFAVFTNNTALKTINIPENCWAIGQYTFRGTAIQTLHIPSSVTLIASGAFWHMQSLSEITVDSNSTEYYTRNGVLFAYGNKEDVLFCYPPQKEGTSYTMPENVSLEWCAFSYAEHLVSIELNDTLKTIPYSAFDSCTNLLSMVIPDSVTLIDDAAFFSCKKLANIQIPANTVQIGTDHPENVFANVSGMTIFGESGSTAETYAKEYGFNFSELGTNLEESGSCGDSLTWIYKDGVLTVRGTGDMDDYGYEEAPWYEYRNSIFKVVIHDGVASIGDRAFEWCNNLVTAELPDSVLKIGQEAFVNCHELKDITFPENLSAIGSSAFSACHGLTSITIPSGTIGWSAFSSCHGMESVTFGENVTTISDRAFEDCIKLGIVTIPENVTSIGTTHSFDSGVRVAENNNVYSSDDDGILYNKNKSTLLMCPISYEGTLIIPNSVSTIGGFAFDSCSGITEVIVPESVKTIEWFAFDSCENLTTLTLGTGLKTIGVYAFRRCYGLTDIKFCGNAPTFGENCFEDVTATAKYPSVSNWTEDVRQNYGGTLTWEGYSVCDGNHDYASTTTPPTCTEEGSTTYTCTLCTDSYTIEIPATGHAAVTDAEVAATCTESGLTEGSHCSVCGEVLIEQQIIEAINPSGHSYNENMLAIPTCTEEGLGEYTCIRCNDSYTAPIPATGHVEVIIPGIDATCSCSGYTAGKYCSTCGLTLVEITEIPQLDHSWDEGTVLREPTCTESGFRLYSCTGGCGNTKEDAIPALGHVEIIDAAVAPTCSKPGLTEGSHCSICGDVIVAQKSVALIEHAWDRGKTTKEPTLTETGVLTYTCTACGGTRTEIIPTVNADVTNNGTTDALDLIALMKHVIGVESAENTDALDLNSDGEVDILDVIRFVRYLAGHKVDLF